MQPVVTTTKGLTDRFAIGDVVFEACKQYWKDTPATNKDLACSQLRKDIRMSQGGIIGKRAGLICSRMSECDVSALGSSCSVNATTASGSLDLCTVEGVSNATIVQGILATAGAHACMTAATDVTTTHGSTDAGTSSLP
jgi:hypothetical protein